MENTFTLSEFLEKKVKDYDPPKLKRKAIVQGHCHHKAIMRLYDDEAVMKKMGLDFQMLNSGCCGMAGSFGFEADKYDVSMQCGERALFPAVRKAGLSTLVMADGFSCREQIRAGHAASRAASRRSDAAGTASARCRRSVDVSRTNPGGQARRSAAEIDVASRTDYRVSVSWGRCPLVGVEEKVTRTRRLEARELNPKLQAFQLAST